MGLDTVSTVLTVSKMILTFEAKLMFRRGFPWNYNDFKYSTKSFFPGLSIPAS